VDYLGVGPDGALQVLERVEGGKHQVSTCAGPPALLGWATGSLPEPPNNPQVGMVNMRTVMPALQRAKPTKVGGEGASFVKVALPAQRRETRIVKDLPVDEIAEVVGSDQRQGKFKARHGDHSGSGPYGNGRIARPAGP
jgi:electron transfer flavoprotein beta subunit